MDDGFVLETGAKVLVRFVTAGRINNTKLDVNGTGAYTIVYRTTTGNYAMGAGSTRLFVYAAAYFSLNNVPFSLKLVALSTPVEGLAVKAAFFVA